MSTLKPLSISKDRKSAPGLDFAALRKKGLEYVQNLSGDKWTDYNLHDPGVTILEELCYAITDLSYRSGFDIKDILTQSWDGKIEAKKNALYTPANILSTKPITINDFRKILIDRIADINNVWLDPIRLPGSTLGFSGLYKVLVQASKRFEMESEADQDRKSALIQKVKDELNRNRNFCEQIAEVSLLEPELVKVRGDILVREGHAPESVLAKVFYEIEKYLYRRVSLYTLQELLDKGYSINEIIDGPKLERGYILDEDLKSKITEISSSSINKIIMEVEGVENVKGLRVISSKGRFVGDGLILNANMHPVLDTEFNEQDKSYTFKTFKNNYEYPLNSTVVNNTLRELWASSHRSYRLASVEEKDIGIPQGNFLNIKTYNSIQNHFPTTYHLLKNSLPRSAPNLRKAQVKQLKAYLLLFEQVLANYFAQIHHTADLFTIEPTKEQMRTYFSQPLFNVPDVGPLLKGFENNAFSSNLKQEDAANGSAQHKGKNYLDGLDQTGESPAVREERKNRLLDHLLARFNERISDFSVSSFDFYYKSTAAEQDLSTAIKLKSRLLRNYAALSYSRGKACDYTKDIWGAENLSGLERKVAVLLNIQNENKRILTDVISSKSMSILKEKVKTDTEERETKEVHWQDETLHIDVVEIEYAGEEIAEHEFKDGNIVFQSNRKDFLRNVLRYGIQLNNYRVGPVTVAYERQYAITYKEPSEKKWKIIGRFSGRKEAKAALRHLIELLRRLSMESEGFHFIEHNLIRPALNLNRYGFFLINPLKKAFLESYELHGYEKRLEVLDEVLKAGASESNYYSDRVDNEQFRLVVHGQEETPIGKSTRHFKLEDYKTDEADIESKKIQELIELIGKKQAAHFPQVKLYTELEDGYQIDEKFFNFQATVVLPLWPARFQDDSFKAHLEEVFKTNAPAHIKLNFVWLDFFEMKKFEDLYRKWSHAKMELADDDQDLTVLTEGMIRFLLLKIIQ